MSPRPSLVIISGPTCVGKTDVAIALAGPLGAEIVSADAMQVYRHMNIGTAKPTEQQRTLVRHHLIDVVDPDERFSAALYKTMAEAAVEDLYDEADYWHVNTGGETIHARGASGRPSNSR